MNPVLRATILYAILWLLFRIAGRRTLGDMTNFDFVVLLVVGDATQQALVGEDYSVTNAAIVIGTLMILDIALSLVKRASPRADTLIDGRPLVIVDHGRPLHDLMHKARVDVEDVLSAARELQGLERLDQIKWAVLECRGTISIIPEETR